MRTWLLNLIMRYNDGSLKLTSYENNAIYLLLLGCIMDITFNDRSQVCSSYLNVHNVQFYSSFKFSIFVAISSVKFKKPLVIVDYLIGFMSRIGCKGVQ